MKHGPAIQRIYRQGTMKDVPTVQIGCRIPKELATAIRLASIKRGVRINELIASALRVYVQGP